MEKDRSEDEEESALKTSRNGARRAAAFLSFGGQAGHVINDVVRITEDRHTLMAQCCVPAGPH